MLFLKSKRYAAMLGAVALGVGSMLALGAGTASASQGASSGVQGVSGISSGGTCGGGTSDTCVSGGADGHKDGSVTIAVNPKADTVTITGTAIAPLTFTGAQICIGDAGSSNPGTAYFTTGIGFTARPNPGGGSSKGCPPSGAAASYFVFQQFSGAGPWTITVPASFVADGMFFSIHVSVSNGDTGFACWASGSPFYGNCGPSTTTQVPLGTIGGIGIAVIAGGGLAFAQIRRRRRHQRAAVTPATIS